MNFADVGLRIKNARKHKKITQQELAKTIGKTESSIRKYEKGLVEIPYKVLEQIADALDINVSDLIPQENKSEAGLYRLVYDIVENTVKTALKESIEDLTEEEVEKVQEYVDLIKGNRKNTEN